MSKSTADMFYDCSNRFGRVERPQTHEKLSYGPRTTHGSRTAVKLDMISGWFNPTESPQTMDQACCDYLMNLAPSGAQWFEKVRWGLNHPELLSNT